MKKQQRKQDFPGYPHYSPDQDITRTKNNNGREPLRRDEQSNNPLQPPYNEVPSRNEDEDTRIYAGTDADVNEEDLRALNATEQDMDSGDNANIQYASLDSVDDDGDPLNEESSLNRNMTADDLDIPGAGGDDANERIGEEDEENNYYSLGGDNHESQEEYKGE